ncbi:hypothetical protein [Bradyrhizobium sp. STM 3562]|uniref:hypothetical protein n=1 Tax=Bradyrhizobium sp. STM 3562 TaxID=578924 RepID=UPI00389002A0
MLALSIGATSAHAHGIAGNRFFVGTVTFDDPAVADEAILPSISTLERPVEGSDGLESRINWSFVRLLTPTIAVSIDQGWIHRSFSAGALSGFDTTNIGIKGEIFRDNRHEALISAGLAWGIGQSGARSIGASAPDTLQPGLFFGKGFGDLPDNLSWLRPLAVTGAIVDEIPLGNVGATVVPDTSADRFAVLPSIKPETLHWGFTIQYSTHYLTGRFTGGEPREEPLNQLVPLVELNFDSPRGQKTAAAINPGFAYVAVTWQIAAEAIVPLNRDAGSRPGFRAQLLFFLDDLIPSVFGKPLLTDQPDRSLIKWN